MNFRIGAARPATLAVAVLVAALTIVCTQRAMAAVVVANAANLTYTVLAGTDSTPLGIPSIAGYPTIVTVTNKTSNDGIRGIAMFSLNWMNAAPQAILWTGTSSGGGVVGGQASAANVVLAGIGPGVTVITDANGANLNRFKIHNTSGLTAAITILEVW